MATIRMSDEKATSAIVHTHTALPLVKFVEVMRRSLRTYRRAVAKRIRCKAFRVRLQQMFFQWLTTWLSIRVLPLPDLLRRQVLSVREDGADVVQIVDWEDVQPHEELLQLISKETVFE
ncbi:hypothetical protein PsorP6_018956 [Peronosclerospora sorghi]|nr:hypothetical protein PsorP6_018956 [Peronosclerospora sorghi]